MPAFKVPNYYLPSAVSCMPLVRATAGARVVKIPAPLGCYWLGLLEVEAVGRQ
jgi:hypothetical protein